MKIINDTCHNVNTTDTWRYCVIGYTKYNKEILVDEVETKIIELLKSLCADIKINVSQIEVEPDSIRFILSANAQLNISKTIRMLQKKLSRVLDKEFPLLKDIGQELWDDSYLISTVNHEELEMDIRIEKFLKSIEAVDYYDIDEGFTTDLDAFKKYLANRKLGIVDYGDKVFLVDKEALAQEINLNCFECTKIYKYGCCCGSPCGFSPENMKMFDKHLLKIEDEIKNLEDFKDRGIVIKGGLIAANGTIKAYNGHCALLVEHEGIQKCIAHKYALDYHMPIYDLCPLSCLMYPLEIMELITDKQKKVILLTSVVEEHFANEFGRWGSYKSLDIELRCIDKTAHNEVFKEEDYKPLYRVNKDLLIHEFGPRVYKGIEQVLT